MFMGAGYGTPRKRAEAHLDLAGQARFVPLTNFNTVEGYPTTIHTRGIPQEAPAGLAQPAVAPVPGVVPPFTVGK